MTKPYHITPEQAFCLIQRLEGLGFNISTQDDPVAMAAFANAVLVEVLGEPVATKLLPDPEDEREGLWFDLADTAKMKALPAGTKLYAPRREK